MFRDTEPRRTLPYVPDDSRGKIMRCIEEWYARYGYAPTVREICEYTEMTSTDTIAGHIDVLVAEGYLTKAKVSRKKGRNLRLTNKRYFF